MSDMSRPRPLPISAEHEQHDALLVAQLAAGDPLDDTRRQEAQGLLSGCPACAALVADLAAVSRAVAQEPVPRRGRDFRIDAEQARRLRGNVVSRFLRGLALPRTRAFAPAAAGMMSFGLAVVVVGYAWPAGGTVEVGPQMNAAPATVEQRAERTLLPAADRIELQSRAGSDQLEEADLFHVEDEPAGALADEAAAAKSMDSSAREALGASIEDAAGAQGQAAEVQAAEAADVAAADVAADAPQPLLAEEAPDDGSVAAYSEALEAEAADDTTPSVVTSDADQAAPATGQVAPAAEIAVLQRGSDLEPVLVAIGMGLALAGGLLLRLAWLARRSRDPLLP